MKRFALVLCVPMGCVPASEARPPAGAAGFDTQPSAATKGELFSSNDGWSIEIQRFVVQLSVAATPAVGSYGRSEPWLFDGRQPSVIYSRALPIGAASVDYNLYGRYLSDSDNDYSERVDTINVDADTVARFNRPPDDHTAPKSQYEVTIGPSLWVTLRAEKDRVVTLDLALNATLTGRNFESPGTPVDVPQDDVGKVKLGIFAENLFSDFDEISEADAMGNGDGRVTADELRAPRLLEKLEARLSFVFVPR